MTKQESRARLMFPVVVGKTRLRMTKQDLRARLMFPVVVILSEAKDLDVTRKRLS